MEVAKYEDRSMPEDFKTMRQILMDVGELLSFVCVEAMVIGIRYYISKCKTEQKYDQDYKLN